MANDFSTDVLVVKTVMLKGEKGDKGDRGDLYGAQWGDIVGTLSDQADLQSALDGIEDDTVEKIGDLQDSINGEIEGLQASISGKADASHTHAISDVTSLQSMLDGKASTSHTHAISDITSLQTTLDSLDDAIDAKADASHTHAISDVTNLQSTITEIQSTISDIEEKIDAKAELLVERTSATILLGGIAGATAPSQWFGQLVLTRSGYTLLGIIGATLGTQQVATADTSATGTSKKSILHNLYPISDGRENYSITFLEDMDSDKDYVKCVFSLVLLYQKES